MFLSIVKTLHYKTCEPIFAINMRSMIDCVDIKPLSRDEFSILDKHGPLSIVHGWWRIGRALIEPTDLFFDTNDLNGSIYMWLESWHRDNCYIIQSLSKENILHFNMKKFDIGQI